MDQVQKEIKKQMVRNPKIKQYMSSLPYLDTDFEGKKEVNNQKIKKL